MMIRSIKRFLMVRSLRQNVQDNFVYLQEEDSMDPHWEWKETKIHEGKNELIWCKMVSVLGAVCEIFETGTQYHLVLYCFEFFST